MSGADESGLTTADYPVWVGAYIYRDPIETKTSKLIVLPLEWEYSLGNAMSCIGTKGVGPRLFSFVKIFVPVVLLFGSGTNGSALRSQPGITSISTSQQSSSADATQNPSTTTPPRKNTLVIVVTDENDVPVAAARAVLSMAGAQNPIRQDTDYSGKAEFTGLNPGSYQITVEKEGFYVLTSKDIQVGLTQRVDITLNHQQELHESMNVTYSPPAVDPTQTEMTEGLTGQEIIDLPYPTTRDIRQALPLIPGVLPDATGQIHVNGSSTQQILDQLDGFNITQPVTGLLTMRVSADAVRGIEMESSRFSSEYGKASGAILNLDTGMGDDHYRFSATNFIPSLQNRKGINFNTWTPRAVFSGPLVKGKAWFFDSPDAEYDQNLVKELPAGADSNPTWRWSNLFKTQVNLSSSNILTSSLLLNHFHSPYNGISQFSPQSTTLNQTESAYLFTIRDQAYFSRGWLLEVGMGISQFHTRDLPQGNLPFEIHPEGTTGNNNQTDDGRARRYQWKADLHLPSAEWWGHHEIRIGTDLDRITYEQTIQRTPISIYREDGTLSRQITFLGNPHFTKDNFESSTYIQDRWTATGRLLIELGVRQDWDSIIRQVLLSPRVASSLMLTGDGKTKLSAGIGLYYDETNLDLVTRSLGGIRSDVSFAADGITPLGPPAITSFQADLSSLREPRFVNWSVGIERELPDSVHLAVNFIEKRGKDGFAYVNMIPTTSNAPTGQYELTNIGRDRFDGVEVDVRHTFRGKFPFLLSYTRSAARSNAVVDFTLNNPIYSPQAGGPLPWDSPNRVLSWGGAPLWKGFNIFYSLDWRDGYPFSVVNQNQQLVGSPDSRRYPAFFSLSLHLERRFSFMGYQLALRAGFNNITNRQNASTVINNIDSPQFLTFGDAEGRVFTARIRFLGKK